MAMVTVGGVTRLTRSGLSIVEWKPISGIIPPLNESEWQTQFDLYKKSPEYQKINSHFELADYQKIFLWEYAHRVLGRILFLFALIPGLYLWRKKLVSGAFVAGLSLLVAFQGLIGWLMVKSGLNINPHVSPYMLALHFFSALTLLLLAFRELCTLRKPLPAFQGEVQKLTYYLLGFTLAIQLFYGCITSGMKAGIGYNTYPLMNGSFFPPDALALNPTLLNFFENPGTVQWAHRWIGMLIFGLFISFLIKLKSTAAWSGLKGPMIHLVGVTGMQVFLGILNIVYVIPIPLAALHQLCATFLVLGYFNIVFRAAKEVEPV